MRLGKDSVAEMLFAREITIIFKIIKNCVAHLFEKGHAILLFYVVKIANFGDVQGLFSLMCKSNAVMRRAQIIKSIKGIGHITQYHAILNSTTLQIAQKSSEEEIS